MRLENRADTAEQVATLALAGNANVGKSVLFNALTGMNQTIGNWPGKTVELAQGSFLFRGRRVRIIDLPGIYSLSAYSQEELVTRDFLASGIADAIINVVDSTVLERNLYLTLQLRELGVPMVVALNFSDVAAREGLEIDTSVLSAALGVPVVKTAATAGKGLEELVAVALTCSVGRPAPAPPYGREVESAIAEVEGALARARASAPSSHADSLESRLTGLHSRFIAIKLLEGDPVLTDALAAFPEVVETARAAARRLEIVHGHDASGVVAAERYAVAAQIARSAITCRSSSRQDTSDIIDAVLLHKVGGWIALVAVLFAMFGAIFVLGNWLSGLLEDAFAGLQGHFLALSLPPALADFLWRGLIEGILAGISIALPYLVPFYVVLSVLENTGYLARMAFLTDVVMHRLGLHGKAFIPMFLGYGCTVPAVLGTRVLERDRDRLITGILATLVPCSARTVVILGLVGAFVGVGPALLLYIVDLAIVLLAGRLLNRYLPGENLGLIMEMPRLRLPAWHVSLRQTLFRLKDFVVFAFPVIVAGSIVLWFFDWMGWLVPIGNALAPFTVYVLGLPPLAVVVLLFGILRKELALIMLAALMGTSDFGSVLTAQQMVVFALILLLYIPCVSTIAVLRKEFGSKTTLLVVLGEVALALILGALLNWTWTLVTHLLT